MIERRLAKKKQLRNKRKAIGLVTEAITHFKEVNYVHKTG